MKYSEKRQPFGQRAKEALSDLVYMKDAQLECDKIDRYPRGGYAAIANIHDGGSIVGFALQRSRSLLSLNSLDAGPALIPGGPAQDG